MKNNSYLRLLVLALACLLTASVQTARAQSDYLLWGYYTDMDGATPGYGFGTTGTFSCAIFVPGNEALKGAKIRAINVPLTTSRFTNVKAWVSAANDFNKRLTSQDIAKIHMGYNYVTLSSPVTIPEEGVMVGYTFTVTGTTDLEKECIVTHPGEAAGSIYLNNGTGWRDYSNFFIGVSALQIYLSDVNLPAYAAQFTDLASYGTAAGVEQTIGATLSCPCLKAVENIDYTVEIGDNAYTGHADLATPSIPGDHGTGNVQITFTAPAELGHYSAKFTVNKVNGKANASTMKPLTLDMQNLLRAEKRYTVIEENTGTSCGNCPRGWVGMEHMREAFPESFIGIAVHQFNVDDPMYCNEYDKIDLGGAPSCIVDRRSGIIDPYYDILNAFHACQAILPEVAVKVNGTFSADKKKVTATSSIEYLGEQSGLTVGYVLTADGLTGKSKAWQQSNYYPLQDVGKARLIPGMESFADFYTGGKYGNDHVTLVYNDVLIGSSWDAEGKNLLKQTLPSGTRSGQPGDIYDIDAFTLTMPTRAALKAALDYDAIYLTALVFNTKGEIVNAARCRVLPEEADGIATLETTDNRQQTTDDAGKSPFKEDLEGLLDLTGRTLNTSTFKGERGGLHGIFIQQGRKVIQ